MFRPGQTGTDHVPPDSTQCADADRIWVVSRDDIAAYYAGAAPEAEIELGRALASGVYVVRVEGTGFAETFTIVKSR